jgi:hypothetical protein
MGGSSPPAAHGRYAVWPQPEAPRLTAVHSLCTAVVSNTPLALLPPKAEKRGRFPQGLVSISLAERRYASVGRG